MTHDELQQRVNDLYTNVNEENPTRAKESKAHYALRAVVELHRNVDGACWECQDSIYHEYPCPTIRAIEKELS